MMHENPLPPEELKKYLDLFSESRYSADELERLREVLRPGNLWDWVKAKKSNFVVLPAMAMAIFLSGYWAGSKELIDKKSLVELLKTYIECKQKPSKP